MRNSPALRVPFHVWRWLIFDALFRNSTESILKVLTTCRFLYHASMPVLYRRIRIKGNLDQVELKLNSRVLFEQVLVSDYVREICVYIDNQDLNKIWSVLKKCKHLQHASIRQEFQDRDVVVCGLKRIDTLEMKDVCSVKTFQNLNLEYLVRLSVDFLDFNFPVKICLYLKFPKLKCVHFSNVDLKNFSFFNLDLSSLALARVLNFQQCEVELSAKPPFLEFLSVALNNGGVRNVFFRTEKVRYISVDCTSCFFQELGKSSCPKLNEVCLSIVGPITIDALSLLIFNSNLFSFSLNLESERVTMSLDKKKLCFLRDLQRLRQLNISDFESAFQIDFY